MNNQEIEKKSSVSVETNYAVYVRVSSDKDEQVSSVENQVDICRNWLERNGFEWDDSSVHFDDAITGTAFLEREAMQLLLAKAKQKMINLVVFKSIHRLARDLKDALEIQETFIAHGVRLVTIEEGYDSFYEGKSSMKFEIYAMFAAQYPKTLSVSIAAAIAAKVRRGEHRGGQPPFGYRANKEKRLEFHPEEYKIVRQMFEWNMAGVGAKNITHRLNDMGYQSRQGGKWQLSTVQTILKNPMYKGTVILNKHTNVKLDGRKKQIKNPPEKWMIYENQHPGIVSAEEFDKVNSKEKSNRTKWSLVNEFRGGTAICGVCGCNMVTKVSGHTKKDGTKSEWRYMICSAYRRGGKHLCIKHETIRYEEFRELIIQRLKLRGQHIKLNVKNGLENKKDDMINLYKKQLQQIEIKKKTLLDIYIDQDISKAEYQSRKLEFEKNIIELNTKISSLNKTETRKKQVETILEAFAKLEDSSQDMYTVFNTLIEKIVVHQNGELEIKYTFEGAL